MTSQADLKVLFPHPTLTPIRGRPSYRSLRKLKAELGANYAAIPSTRGGAIRGHLGSFLDPPAYALLNGTIPWVEPVHPGVHPGHAPGTTGPQITEANRIHKEACDEATTCTNTHSANLQIMIPAIPSTYMQAFNHPTYGFAGVLPRTIVDHLVTRYGQMQPEDKISRKDEFKAPWNPDDPIENLWSRSCNLLIEAAENGVPISEDRAINYVLAVLRQTGVFTLSLNRGGTAPLPTAPSTASTPSSARRMTVAART